MEEKIKLQFSIRNYGPKEENICILNTPLTSIKKAFFRIYDPDLILMHEKSEAVLTKARRLSHVMLLPKRQKICTINLRNNFHFAKFGQYSIHFLGTDVNKLPDSNIVHLKIISGQ